MRLKIFRFEEFVILESIKISLTWPLGYESVEINNEIKKAKFVCLLEGKKN